MTKEEEIAVLDGLLRQCHEALWLLAGDVEARMRSCTCHPPATDQEKANLARANQIVSDFADDLIEASCGKVEP